MERRDLALTVIPHPHSLVRAREEWQQIVGRPTIETRCRPGVVVDAAAPDRGAAIVRRATANHHRSLERHDAIRVRVLRGVLPVVRISERTGVEEITGPAATLE